MGGLHTQIQQVGNIDGGLLDPCGTNALLPDFNTIIEMGGGLGVWTSRSPLYLPVYVTALHARCI